MRIKGKFIVKNMDTLEVVGEFEYEDETTKFAQVRSRAHDAHDQIYGIWGEYPDKNQLNYICCRGKRIDMTNLEKLTSIGRE